MGKEFESEYTDSFMYNWNQHDVVNLLYFNLKKEKMLITTRFPKCIKNINLWIEEALKSSGRTQREQAQSKHILLRLLKIRERQSEKQPNEKHFV